MARAWASSGRGSGAVEADRFRDEAARFNLPPRDVERFLKRHDKEVVIWRENWVACQVFFALHIESVGTMNGIHFMGVRESEIRGVFESQGWPRFAWRRFRVFESVKFMVSQALQVLNKR